MNTLDVGNNHLQTGVRVETTQSSYTGYHVTVGTTGHYLSTSPVGGNQTYTNVLPSVQYRYQTGADGGIAGPNGDVYLYPHTQLDAQASYTIARQLQIVVAGLNLNNEVFGFYQGSPQFPIQREFYNRTLSVGVRITR